MKRHGGLWPTLVSYENLLDAAEKARRHKRSRPDVMEFDYRLEHELGRLRDELLTRTYTPGAYRTFLIREPKTRMISAAPYRDRVVHHALCNVLAPIYEKSFVFHSYASRPEKGTHAAIRQAQRLARRWPYVLKADIRKYFPSIDHEVLKGLLARKVKDRDVLWLAGRIIDHANEQEAVELGFADEGMRARGLPLGNQTSQFFANVYLDALDHHLVDRRGATGYVRYMDDLLVFGEDPGSLRALRDEIGAFLEDFRLRLHANKSVVFPVRCGIGFLGQRVFPTHRLLAKSNVRRFRRRLRGMARAYAAGEIELTLVRQRIQSWLGHARQADTYRVRVRVLGAVPFVRGKAKVSA